MFLEDVILYAYTGKVLLYCVKAFVTILTFLPRAKYIRSRSWDSTCSTIFTTGTLFIVVVKGILRDVQRKGTESLPWVIYPVVTLTCAYYIKN